MKSERNIPAVPLHFVGEYSVWFGGFCASVGVILFVELLFVWILVGFMFLFLFHVFVGWLLWECWKSLEIALDAEGSVFCEIAAGALNSS